MERMVEKEDEGARSPLEIPEILQMIFDHLPSVRDVGSLLTVCRTWSAVVVESSLLWKARCWKSCPGAVDLIEFKKRMNSKQNKSNNVEGYTHWKKSVESYSNQGWFFSPDCNFGHLVSNLKLGLYFSRFMIEHGLSKPESTQNRSATRSWLRSNLYIWLHCTVVNGVNGGRRSNADKVRAATLHDVALEAVTDHHQSIRDRFRKMIEQDVPNLGAQLFNLWKEQKIFSEVVGFIFHNALYNHNAKLSESHQEYDNSFRATLCELLPNILEGPVYTLPTSEVYLLKSVLSSNSVNLFDSTVAERGLGEIVDQVERYEPSERDYQILFELADDGLGTVVIGAVEKLLVVTCDNQLFNLKELLTERDFSIIGFLSKYQHLWRK